MGGGWEVGGVVLRATMEIDKGGQSRAVSGGDAAVAAQQKRKDDENKQTNKQTNNEAKRTEGAHPPTKDERRNSGEKQRN